jgi:hypothetical protein
MVVSSLPVKAQHEDNLTRAIWRIWIMDGEAYGSLVLSGSPSLRGLDWESSWQAEETCILARHPGPGPKELVEVRTGSLEM